MSQPSYAYIGLWVDWSQGPVRGATLTLSHTSTGLLIAFIALLVSAAGGAVWKVVSYITHQLRTQREPRDGLHHQEQNILRNCSSPSTALVELLQLTWAWRKNADYVFFRSIPLQLSAAMCLGLFTLAGIFSATAIKATGTDTLTRSPLCGTIAIGKFNDSDYQPLATYNLQRKLNAAGYATTCYNQRQDPLRCNLYTKQALPFSVNNSASCPFAPGTCCFSDTAGYQMDTGKLDSNLDLGINAREEERVTLQRVTTCAPIYNNNYTRIEQGVEYGYYGSVIWGTGIDPNSNYTYWYSNESARYIDGYKLS